MYSHVLKGITYAIERKKLQLRVCRESTLQQFLQRKGFRTITDLLVYLTQQCFGPAFPDAFSASFLLHFEAS